jgi:Domain of unknown function (DUF202)
MPPPDELEELQPGLARERTQLAWTRTAIAFAAVGGAMLKTSVIAGVIVLLLSGVIWALRRLFDGPGTAIARPRRMLLVTATVTAVALVALVVAIFGHGQHLR